MMLQRKDLAKEFSLIVQQEIKNHRDVVLSAHVALEEFRRKIKELSDKTDKGSSLAANLFSENDREIKKLEKVLSNSLHQFSVRLNESNEFMKSNFNGLKKSIDDRESYFLSLDGFKEFESKVDQWISHLKIAFSSQRQFLLDEINSMSMSITKEIDKCRRELDFRINSCKEDFKDINKSLDIFALNSDGIKREIELCKKRCFVVEKNIENIYTQIRRNNMGEK